MTNKNLTVRGWRDYELIDSGDNRKLERYGKFFLIRPETQALWAPARLEEWKRADAEFQFAEGKGNWSIKAGKGKIPESWDLSWNDVRFTIRLGSFKHTGIFPEQAANWEWIAERVMTLVGGRRGGGERATGSTDSANPPQVLNLFGYTGIASIVAAKAGARVTHVDASKQSNQWAKENAALSEIAGESGERTAAGERGAGIRYIFDDALKFVEREVRRGAKYDGIILDPPAFGRGAKGEVWHIEEQLPRLLVALAKIFADKHNSFFLLNGYAAGYSPESFAQAVTSVGAFPEAAKLPSAEFGELQILETNGDDSSDFPRCVPSGIYFRFVK
jgi:23S rRNA (cytosine1962-C5)-methyltransferase